MTADPFGRALRDHWHKERTEPLVQRDGPETLDHPIEEYYFSEPSHTTWLDRHLDGPLLDLGAGAGKHALYFQDSGEVTAIEPSENLVALLAERGVEDARKGDMFSLREQFDRNQFRSALAYGTQAGLAGSMQGLSSFLGDLAFVTEPNGTAVIDGLDPTHPATAQRLGYRADPTPGLASRVMQFEYSGELGEILLFRLFSPERLREAAIGTGWELTDVREDGPHYLVTFSKKE